MAKKKVVLMVSLDCPKRRQKALQIAAGFPGVTSASVEDDRIVLVGDGFDPVALTNVLRKRVGCCVELISVAEVKKEEPKPKPPEPKPCEKCKPPEPNPCHICKPIVPNPCDSCKPIEPNPCHICKPIVPNPCHSCIVVPPPYPCIVPDYGCDNSCIVM